MEKQSIHHTRQKGREAESLVDNALNQWGWFPAKKNLIIPGGEIDRIYINTSMGEVNLCYGEIKSRIVHNQQKMIPFLSQCGLKSLYRVAQLRRLIQYHGRQGSSVYRYLKPRRVYFRLFVVFQFLNKKQPAYFPKIENSHFRWLEKSPNQAIFSLAFYSSSDLM